MTTSTTKNQNNDSIGKQLGAWRVSLQSTLRKNFVAARVAARQKVAAEAAAKAANLAAASAAAREKAAAQAARPAATIAADQEVEVQSPRARHGARHMLFERRWNRATRCILISSFRECKEKKDEKHSRLRRIVSIICVQFTKIKSIQRKIKEASRAAGVEPAGRTALPSKKEVKKKETPYPHGCSLG